MTDAFKVSAVGGMRSSRLQPGWLARPHLRLVLQLRISCDSGLEVVPAGSPGVTACTFALGNSRANAAAMFARANPESL